MFRKYYEIKNPPYGENSKYLEVRTLYVKGKGYTCDISPVGLDITKDNVRLVSKMYCSEYFTSYCIPPVVVVEAYRKNAARERKADSIISANVNQYIADYLDKSILNYGKELKLTGVVIE